MSFESYIILSIDLLAYKVWRGFCSTPPARHTPSLNSLVPIFPHTLRWLPRVSTKVTIRTGKTCKRSPRFVVLQSLFLNFTSKVTNIITLVIKDVFIVHRGVR